MPEQKFLPLSERLRPNIECAPWVIEELKTLEARLDVLSSAVHPDDLAVDRFASAMKAKLEKSRSKGRGGWEDPDQCTVEHLARLLIEHIPKGDPVDVANFAMMLHQRGAGLSVLSEVTRSQKAKAEPVLDDNEEASLCSVIGMLDRITSGQTVTSSDRLFDASVHPRKMTIKDAQAIAHPAASILRKLLNKLRDADAHPAAAPVLQWFTVADHGMPDLGEEVIGGLWYTDPCLIPEKATLFIWGPCRVLADQEFPDGKRWYTFGPSHNQITHWVRINAPGNKS